MAQRLRFRLPIPGVGAGSVPDREAKIPRAWRPTNQNQKQNCNEFKKDFLENGPQHKPVTVQCCMADSVSGTEADCWTHESTGLRNSILEPNTFVCRELTL